MNLNPVYPITSDSISPYIDRPVIVLVRGNRAFYGILESVDTSALSLAPLQQPTVTEPSKVKNKKAFKSHKLRLNLTNNSGRKIMRIKALTPKASPLTIPLVLVTNLFVFPDAIGEEH